MHKIYIKNLNYKYKVSTICYKYIAKKMEIFQTSETSSTGGYVGALTSRPSGWWRPSQPCGPAGWWCSVFSGILLHSESSSHPVSPGTARGGSDQRGGTCCSTPSAGCSHSPLWQHFMKTKHKTYNKQEVNQCLTLSEALLFNYGQIKS